MHYGVGSTATPATRAASRSLPSSVASGMPRVTAISRYAASQAVRPDAAARSVTEIAVGFTGPS